MNSKVAIELNDIVLDFPSNYSKFTFFKEIISRRNQKNKHFRALDNINLKINQGEVFGIIGPNGAGKSTILRVIAGIYAPDEGQVTTRGRIVLLAGLGAGFQANLTGRENIFLSSSIYGMKEQDVTRLEESIIGFAGIQDFIDRPLRTYSSGMKARLAFSIASHLEPEILLIDEVLAVGDSAFREKSKKRIINMVKGDTTVVLVSHSEPTLRDLCDRVACFSDGKIDCVSENADIAIERYHELSELKRGD
ncbi:MAG: ABC transporter ATP-binding protein [Candidatus Poseidoniaceae archaeon]